MNDRRQPPRPFAGALLGALVVATSMVSADPAVDSILSRIYDGYDQQNACWRARSETPGGFCCLKIDRQDRIETASGQRLYVLLAGGCFDSEGKPEDTHVSTGMIGALAIGIGPNEISILAGDPRMPMGSWGTAPTDWTLVKLEPADYWGWLNTLGYTGQGRTESVYMILAPYGKRIRDLGGIKAGFDDAGACVEEDHCPSTALETKLDIDSLQLDAKVFPLLITLTGQIEGRPIAPKTWTLPFDPDSWTYVEPDDWPLAADE
ncbi:hypothetical protein [uncultured Thiocystis sp.]|uniref:hypothetical protein n=1 Tax=uncultured Thiocystis sp. TaxID=1202134 RepID=UPI0025F8D379|nr:hypothetical protein [uncultured Thiocystis sp.]